MKYVRTVWGKIKRDWINIMNDFEKNARVIDMKY